LGVANLFVGLHKTASSEKCRQTTPMLTILKSENCAAQDAVIKIFSDLNPALAFPTPK
jgi:hypothetical protein